MTFRVRLTQDAVRDLEELKDYIAAHDAPEKADYLLDRIEDTLRGLAALPERGVVPAELREIGIRDYREVFFKPYRIIFRAIGNNIYVYLIVDGRRNMQSLLQRRLLA